MMVVLTTVRMRLQQAATEMREDHSTDIVLALEELDGPASTCLGYALRLMASSFNSLLEKRRKEAVWKVRGNNIGGRYVQQGVHSMLRLSVQR